MASENRSPALESPEPRLSSSRLGGSVSVASALIMGFGLAVCLIAGWALCRSGRVSSKARYFVELVNGPFQDVCVASFVLGCLIVLWVFLLSFLESRQARAAADFARELRKRWGVSAGDGARPQSDQGSALLSLMREKGLAEGEPAASRLNRPSLVFGRLHRLGLFLLHTKARDAGELMEINRDLSGLDSEHLSSRLTIVRYLVYLIPVIGFLGTVFGISQAMLSIGETLPHVKDLDGFMVKLQVATTDLRVSFDTTLLALICSGLLTFLSSLVVWFNEDFIRRADLWMIDNVLGYVTEENEREAAMRALTAEARKWSDKGLTAMEAMVKHGPAIHGVGQRISSQLAELEKKLGHAFDKASATIHELKEVAECVAEKTLEIKGAVDQIAGAQAEGQGRVQELAKAVRSLPGLAEGLDSASDKMRAASEGVAGLASLAGRLETFARSGDHLGQISERFGQALEIMRQVHGHTGSLREMRGAMIKNVQANGQAKQIDLISAIEHMRESLNEQFKKISDSNNQQIANAMKNVSSAHVLLANNLNGINQGFLQLAEEIRNLLPLVHAPETAIVNGSRGPNL